MEAFREDRQTGSLWVRGIQEDEDKMDSDSIQHSARVDV